MRTKDLGNKEIMSVNIKRHLNNKGLNVKEFAEIMNFKYTTVLDWVNAKTYPRIDKIELMARYFGVDKSDLVEEYIESTSTLSEINRISSQLEEPRQEVVLNTAKEQRDEQEAERKAKKAIPLYKDEEKLYSYIDEAAAWQAEDLSEEDRETIMITLRDHLEKKAKEDKS